MGSLALGSFLLGLIDFLKIIIGFFHKYFSQREGEEKGYCHMCCQCCFSWFDSFLKFISRHAYIQIAMTGESFCKATDDAFYLLTRNAMRFGMVHGLAWVFLLLGQIFITLVATVIGNIVITNSDTFSGRIYSNVTPTLMFALVSWIVSDVFMGVYGISADAIIHCFAMDEEIHDGVAEHAPQQLRNFINGNMHKKLLSDSS